MDLQLANNTAVTTASTSGLGLASARALAREGADVVICGRTSDRLERAATDLRSEAAGDVLAVQADVTNKEEVDELIEQTVDTFGGIDHLVTSAGGVPATTFEETSLEQWQQAYDTLVMNVVHTLEAAHPYLLESDHGSVVCITSRTVQEVADGLLLSNSVRRGVIGLVKTVSREFAPEIRVNAVLPGTIETPRVEELIETQVERGEVADYEAGLAGFTDEIPLERLGSPDELGEVVTFLLSDRASYVNGAAIPIDGGQLRS